MRVRVLLFGMLKDIAGKSSDLLDLPEQASVRDVLARYESTIPHFKESLPSLAFAINHQYADAHATLHDGDEVAILPPVSGGLDDRTKTEARRSSHTSIVRERIDAPSIRDALSRPEDGAVAVFEGIVRNHSRGRKTLYLDYEAYEDMALQQMESLAEHALKEFKIRDVAVVHRLGRLEVGETSVLIVVVSAHRAPAFDACRWLIDTLKRKVPIWKKEFFEDGAVWADGEPFPAEIPRANS